MPVLSASQALPRTHQHAVSTTHVSQSIHPFVTRQLLTKRGKGRQKKPSGLLPSTLLQTLLTAVAMNQCKRHINSATKRHIYC